MAAIDDLKTAVIGLETQLAANQTLLQSIAAQLAALTAAGTPIDPAAVEAVAQQITTDTTALAAADAAATPGATGATGA